MLPHIYNLYLKKNGKAHIHKDQKSYLLPSPKAFNGFPINLVLKWRRKYLPRIIIKAVNTTASP
jgi:hypothetical protein